MSRASRRDNSISTSLMPFLAVLLCTMGVLVVLLVVMASVQRSHAQSKHLADATRLHATHDPAEQETLRAEMKELDARQGHLEQIRAEISNRLDREQERLSQIEENIRRRQERLALVRLEIEELQALDDGKTDDLEQARAALDRQRRLIADTKAELEQLKKEKHGRDNYYAIVPYDGSGGTRRQPIYIECRHDCVVFQPENIVLTPADFNEVIGAGGPLPAAIRAAQRYYIDNGIADRERPYPLVIARPDASGSFARVLATLSDINADFGYEIVDADWQFDFSAADPAVSIEMQRAIDNAAPSDCRAP